MNLYLLLKTLHILSSTILFGTGLGSAYYALRAWRSGQLPVIAVTFRHLVAADWLFIATTAVFQPLSGLAMVHVAGWSLAQGWLLWSLGLYVFAGLCWLPVVWLQIRVRDMAEAALRGAAHRTAGVPLHERLVHPRLAGLHRLHGHLLPDGQQAGLRVPSAQPEQRQDQERQEPPQYNQAKPPGRSSRRKARAGPSAAPRSWTME